MWFSHLVVCAMCIFTLSMVVPITNCQKVVHMQVRTADEPEAGMSLASVDVELQNEEGNTCIITQLNSDTLFDFSPGGYSMAKMTFGSNIHTNYDDLFRYL